MGDHRAAKRPRFNHRGEDDYVPGNIVEIEMHNFMTYDHLKCKPGARLNLVIGPNGSGKSSLVCPIALGLTGEPQVHTSHLTAPLIATMVVEVLEEVITAMESLDGVDRTGLLTVGDMVVVGVQEGILAIEMRATMVEIRMTVIIMEATTGGEGEGDGMAAAEEVEVAEMAVGTAVHGMGMRTGHSGVAAGIGVIIDLLVAVEAAVGQLIVNQRNHLPGVMDGTILMARRESGMVGMMCLEALLGTKAQLRKGVVREILVRDKRKIVMVKRDKTVICGQRKEVGRG